MTTAKTPKSPNRFRLPDPPERNPEDMTSFKHLARTGNVHYLEQHLGNRETIVGGDLFLAFDRRGPGVDFRIPDLLIAFNADPELYEQNNGYVISEQGKPPDFVLEIASPSTRAADNSVKRDFYARHGVLEYWRFDEEDSPNMVKLAGDHLVDGRYVAIRIEELPGSVLQGYSRVLNLNLRWEKAQLVWYDPVAERPIVTLEDERDRADAAERARAQAEARVRELETELRRLRES